MPSYRVTIRHGAPRARYEAMDVEAPDLKGALLAAAERMPPDVAATAELAEIRALTELDARGYTPG